MNPAPHSAGNFEFEKFRMMEFYFIKAIYLNIKGGAG